VNLKSTPPLARAKPEPELHEVLVAARAEKRRLDLTCAKAFAQFEASAAFLFHESGSLVEYGLKLGYGERETRDYAAAGRVILLCADAEKRLLDGSMAICTLAILEPYFTQPDLRPTEEDGTPMPFEAILAWAAVRTDRELRRAVHRRREEARTGEQTVARTFHFTSQGVDDLDRAQELTARKKHRAVSQSEAVQTALREYVEKHDDLERKPGTRRMPHMPPRDDGGRHPRGIPAEVKRELMRRYGDQCAIEGCPHRLFLENSHHLAHALGGGNELADQDRICSVHHKMKDHGQITWVPDAAYPGGGYYRGSDGRIIPLRVPRENPRESGPPRSGSPRSGPRAAPPDPSAPSDQVRESLSRLRPSRIDGAARPTRVSGPDISGGGVPPAVGRGIRVDPPQAGRVARVSRVPWVCFQVGLSPGGRGWSTHCCSRTSRSAERKASRQPAMESRVISQSRSAGQSWLASFSR
jgi:hypothetical protein